MSLVKASYFLVGAAKYGAVHSSIDRGGGGGGKCLLFNQAEREREFYSAFPIENLPQTRSELEYSSGSNPLDGKIKRQR
jgi:hypothetical protein